MYLKSINVTLNQHFRISEGSCDAKETLKSWLMALTLPSQKQKTFQNVKKGPKTFDWYCLERKDVNLKRCKTEWKIQIRVKHALFNMKQSQTHIIHTSKQLNTIVLYTKTTDFWNSQNIHHPWKCNVPQNSHMLYMSCAMLYGAGSAFIIITKLKSSRERNVSMWCKLAVRLTLCDICNVYKCIYFWFKIKFNMLV